jgi:hypothetical protein
MCRGAPGRCHSPADARLAVDEVCSLLETGEEFGQAVARSSLRPGVSVIKRFTFVIYKCS